MKRRPGEDREERLNRLQREANFLSVLAHNLPGAVPAWVVRRVYRLARIRQKLNDLKQKEK